MRPIWLNPSSINSSRLGGGGQAGWLCEEVGRGGGQGGEGGGGERGDLERRMVWQGGWGGGRKAGRRGELLVQRINRASINDAANLVEPVLHQIITPARRGSEEQGAGVRREREPGGVGGG
jgi:hypothetical protein